MSDVKRKRLIVKGSNGETTCCGSIEDGNHGALAAKHVREHLEAHYADLDNHNATPKMFAFSVVELTDEEVDNLK